LGRSTAHIARQVMHHYGFLGGAATGIELQARGSNSLWACSYSSLKRGFVSFDCLGFRTALSIGADRAEAFDVV